MSRCWKWFEWDEVKQTGEPRLGQDTEEGAGIDLETGKVHESGGGSGIWVEMSVEVQKVPVGGCRHQGALRRVQEGGGRNIPGHQMWNPYWLSRRPDGEGQGYSLGSDLGKDVREIFG